MTNNQQQTLSAQVIADHPNDLIHDTLAPLRQHIQAWTADWEQADLPQAYTLLSGRLDATPVQLKTHRRLTAGLLHLTWAELSETESGKLRALTLYALPRPESPLPILGFDYVGFGGMFNIAALDLAPLDASFWETHARPCLAAIQEYKAGLIERKLPDFAKETFSPLPLVVAARGESACRLAVAHAISCLNIYAVWLQQAWPPVDPEAGRQRLQKWCRAMASNKKEAGALARLFGPVSEAYLQDYLFAEPTE